MDQKASIDLVRAAQGGDDAAFSALFEQNKNSVYYIGLQMLKKPADAEDLVQDVFLTVYQKLPTLAEPAAFGGWLARIAANRCKDKLAKKKDVLFSGEEEDAPPEPEEEGTDFLPEEALEQQDVADTLLAAVRALPEAQRLVVLLFYYQQMKTADIAAALAISENTVKSRLSYARKHLSRALAEHKEEGRLYSISAPALLLLLQRDALAQAPAHLPTVGSILTSGAGQGAVAANGVAKAPGMALKFKAMPAAAKVALTSVAAAAVLAGSVAVYRALPAAVAPLETATAASTSVLSSSPMATAASATSSSSASTPQAASTFSAPSSSIPQKSEAPAVAPEEQVTTAEGPSVPPPEEVPQQPVAETVPPPASEAPTPSEPVPQVEPVEEPPASTSIHVHSHYLFTELEATCFWTGRLFYRCSECAFGNYDVEVAPIQDHDYSTWMTVYGPTVTEPGLQRLTCRWCNEYSEEREIPAMGE